MSCFRFALAAALLTCSLGLVAPPAAAATDSAARPELKQKAKKVQPKKKPAAQKKSAQKPRAKQAKKAAAKPSTDTETKITKPGAYSFVIQHGGMPRTYRVHVPARYNPATFAPLLVALHGGGDMALKANDRYYGLISKSEREGFVLVFPNGYSRPPDGKVATWNAGNCCGSAHDDKVDDVGFIRQVVTNLFGQMSIDRQRIYAVGMSQGGMMAYRLACEMSEVFGAIAVVAATDNTRSCSPRKPVSVLHIHASDDALVRFDGGTGPDVADRSKATDFTSVPVTVAKWAQLNACRMTPRRTLDTAGASCEAYSWCRGKTEVQLCVTGSGGHSWPGGKSPRPGRPPSNAISATNAMWDFLSRH